MHLLPILAAAALSTAPVANVQSDGTYGRCGDDSDRTPLSNAQRLFFNGQYEQTADLTSTACEQAESLELCELRTSALLFQIKQAFGEGANKDKAWKNCVICRQVMPTFLADTTRGQTAARAKLRANPDDEATRFLLAKLDLNYVWLQLGVLGRRTGWGEYWEARHELDKVLSTNAGNLRARVARAWIDYIVDTKMPLGTRWLLGGGNKKRGLATMRQAATAEGDFYARSEAGFALWDVQTREKQMSDAVVTARRLACDFPDNAGLRRFLQKYGTSDAP